VHSAMPSVRARRLCPQAIFLPASFERYSAASRKVMALFADVTPLVEPLSLDEAFLDVTAAQRRAGPPSLIAADLRQRVAEDVGLACSVGVAPTKFLAKLASEAAKPAASPAGPVPGAGVLVVPPGEELRFLHPLPLRALWGVGPATLVRLERLGVASVGALAALPEAAVTGALGDAVGRHLWSLANGVDERPVEPDRPVKSIGHEETFAHDLHERDRCERELVRLADAVGGRLRRHGLAGRTVTLKLRYGDFRTVTRSRTSPDPLDGGTEIARVARALFARLDIAAGVRLLGVSVGGLGPAADRQLSLDALVPGAPSGAGGTARNAGWQEAGQAVDAIRERFGQGAIGPGVLASPEGLDTLRRGARAWGPDDT
jgi:DNA polymerase-4